MTLTASSLDRLAQHRQQFPALLTKHYFNYGGQGVLPEAAIAAIAQAHRNSQQQGPFSTQVNQWMNQEMAQTREAIAQQLHVSPHTISLTENVTIGCNIVLWGIDWQAGDHLLLTDCEHPGVVGAALELQQRFGIEVSTCPMMETLNQGDPATVIAQHLRPTTRLVVLSHILWNTGQVLPLQEIVAQCHQFRGESGDRPPVQVLVDAAQSIGVLPLDLEALGVDAYAFTGHKWLCGPAGLGGLYLSPAAQEVIRPTMIGWRSVTKNSQGHPTGFSANSQRYEIATSDFTLYGALRGAIALHDQWGTSQDRYQRICQLSSYLWHQLQDMPRVTCLRTAPPEAGLVSFTIADTNHASLVSTLEENGFLLRTILDPDCIRACVHYLTLEQEIDDLIQALRQLL